MTPQEYIRRHVLGLTQVEMAERFGVDQTTVSRWERKGFFPPDIQRRIREMQKGRPWNDSWFFEVPVVEVD